MAGSFKVSYVDYTKEKSAVDVHTVGLTAGNYAATITLMDAFRAAVDAVTLGNKYKTEYVAEVELLPLVYPTDQHAQIENKWLVQAVDAVTGFAVSFTVPTADASLLTGNSDFLDIEAGAGLALKDAAEDVVRSRAGNAIIVNAVKFVGRNV